MERIGTEVVFAGLTPPRAPLGNGERKLFPGKDLYDGTSYKVRVTCLADGK